jgi:hypothetical protein
MDTGTALIGTALVVTVGKWADKKTLDAKTFVGVGVFAISLALIGASHPELSSQFATLVLVGAFLMYMIPIAKMLGFYK